MSSAEQTIKLLILTPERKFMEKEVGMVTVPAFFGEMGILPDHISAVIALTTGLVKVYEDNVVIESIFVNGGFVEITQEQITILIEGAMDKSQVNYKNACARMEEIELQLLNVDDQDYKKILEQEYATYQKMAEISDQY